jgi:hypothetical protein
MTPAKAELHFRCRVPAPESAVRSFTMNHDSGGLFLTKCHFRTNREGFYDG